MTEANDLLKKFGLARDAKPREEFDDDEATLACYGYLRGRSDRPTMLTLKFKTGRQFAVAYSWLYSADYDPSRGVTVNCGESLILIEGRNLNHLYECLTRHRLTWILEGDPLRDLSDDAATQITGITLRKASME